MSEYECCLITGVEDASEDVKVFTFDEALECRPGQYVMVWIPDVSENPISVMDKRPLRLAIRKVRDSEDERPFTHEVQKLKPGDKLWIRGPYGNSFLDFHKGGVPKDIMAGGTGAASLLSLAKALYKNDENMEVFLGARTRAELLFVEEFRKVCKKVAISTDDGSYGIKGFVVEFLDIPTKIKDPEHAQLYICGPEKMMAVAAAKAVANNMKPENIILSLERYMKCSRGLCGACAVDDGEGSGLRLCVDGPIFTYAQLEGGDFGKRRRDKSGLYEPVK